VEPVEFRLTAATKKAILKLASKVQSVEKEK
jgi:hypothetical protein